MRIERESPHEWGDDVQRSLRALYAPPAESAYWAELERRIMDRVTGSSAVEWWSVFQGWTRFGLIAASVAALLTAAAAARSRAVEARLAYEAVIEAPDNPLNEIETASLIPRGAARNTDAPRPLLPR